MAKKNSRRSATNNLATSYFTKRKTRRHAVPLPPKQLPMKIEGVRMQRSRWVAEIKHPEKKNVRIWLGSYATQDEASKAYQLKKMEQEEIKLQDASKKDNKLIGDQQVESLSDDRDVAMKGTDIDDQAMEVVYALKGQVESLSDEREELKLQGIAKKDQEVASPHVESNAESLFDDPPDVTMRVVDFVDKATKVESQSNDRDVTMNVVDSGDQVMKVICSDQAERSLSRRRVEQEAGDMLLQLGPILIDRYGCLLGEFSWMDDLSIV